MEIVMGKGAMGAMGAEPGAPSEPGLARRRTRGLRTTPPLDSRVRGFNSRVDESE
jgi:hypothetical protein